MSTLAQNLERLFPRGQGIFLAYDQGLEHGPTDFAGPNQDPDYIMRLAAEGHYDGVIVHHGIAEKYYAPYRDQVPLVVKLNGKTSLHHEEPLSLALSTVEEAVAQGAIAVGYTVYVGSAHEAEMLSEFGHIVDQAHRAGLVVFGWMYPRGSEIKDPYDPKTIAYAARTGLEVGADAVKVFYPGSLEALSEVVAVAGKAKVVVAGGTKTEPAEFLDQAKAILGAGAAGLAVGRNVWQAEDPAAVSAALHKLKES